MQFQNQTVGIYAYYDYGTENQKEATDITFDIKENKTGTDPTLLKGIKSGTTDSSGQITGRKKVYIANPSGAEKEFTVTVTQK